VRKISDFSLLVKAVRVFLYCPAAETFVSRQQRAGAASEGDALLCPTDILSTCLTGPGIPPEVTEGIILRAVIDLVSPLK